MSNTEKLAIDGGTPVRAANDRPWPTWPPVSAEEWDARVGPAMREVYLSATEGLGGTPAERFARRFAAMCGVKHARLLVHGTDAIAAALTACLDLHVWDDPGEIIVPNYTYIASASAPLDRRFSVCFADVDPATFTLCPDALEAAIGPDTVAVLPVHLAGHPADMDRINEVAARHGLAVVTDCAQAHGASYKGRSIGGLARAGAFSFQSSKNLTGGEGGLVTTDDQAVDDRVAAFMNCGRHPRGERWEYPRIGWNYRPSQYVAALLDTRLDSLEAQAEHRSRMAAHLSRRLGEIDGVRPPAPAEWCTRHAWHLYCMQIDVEAFGGRARDEVIDALRAEGIPCWAGYTTPLSDQPGLRALAERHPDAIRVADCPNARRASEGSVWLLQQILLAEREDMDEIVEAFAKVRRAYG